MMKESSSEQISGQKLFSNKCIYRLQTGLIDGSALKHYLNGTVASLWKPEDVLVNHRLQTSSNHKLRLSEGGNDYDFENSKIIYEAYMHMNMSEATDHRIWTYLAHDVYWDYMISRRPIPAKNPSQYIMNHWFIKSVNSGTLFRHDIALLWWGSHLTYDKTRSDRYELTRELFSMLDYTRSLMPSVQARNNNVLRAILEFVIENKDLFSKYKEARIRYLVRVKLNRQAGYNIISSLTKEKTKDLLSSYKKDLATVVD